MGVNEWIVLVIRVMYEDATAKVRLNGRKSKAFNVKAGVHPGSVLSPLLFIIVLKALPREFREGLPMELLYADDLVLAAESEELLIEKLREWKKEWKQSVLERMLFESSYNAHYPTSIDTFIFYLKLSRD